jgi:hypothetical protein
LNVQTGTFCQHFSPNLFDDFNHLAPVKPIIKMTKTRLIDRFGNEPGLIYFIGNDQKGPVKIGFTSHSDPSKRLRQLQTASPDTLSVLGSIGGTIEQEKEIHAFLMHNNIRGEWFERGPALAMFQHLRCGGIVSLGDNIFFNRLWHVAIEIKDKEWTANDSSHEDLESIAEITARNILLDTVARLRCCRGERPLPLLAWLIDQVHRKDVIGDLAKRACNDYDFPSAGSVFDYINYVASSPRYLVYPAVIRAIINSWIECRQAIISI